MATTSTRQVNLPSHQTTYPRYGRFGRDAQATRAAMPRLEFGLLTMFRTWPWYRPPLSGVTHVPLFQPEVIGIFHQRYPGESLLRMQPFFRPRHPSGLPDQFPLRSIRPTYTQPTR